MLSLARRVEYIEGHACAQLQLALPAQLRATLGIRVIWDGDAVSLLAAAVDIGSFNRAIGFGFDRELSDEQLRAILAPYIVPASDVGSWSGVPRHAHEPPSIYSSGMADR